MRLKYPTSMSMSELRTYSCSTGLSPSLSPYAAGILTVLVHVFGHTPAKCCAQFNHRFPPPTSIVQAAVGVSMW